jgi:hypothetical protein
MTDSIEARRARYPRVTSVTGKFADFSRIDPVVLKRAALRGSLVHEVAAVALRNRDMSFGCGPDTLWLTCLAEAHAALSARSEAGDSDARDILDFADREADVAEPYFRSFLSWLDLIEEVRCVETRMWHDAFRYTGQIDAVVRYAGDGGFCIVDFKTPETFSALWRPQLAAYAMLCDANGITYARCGALMLKKTGRAASFRETTQTLNRDKAGFRNALEAVRYFGGLNGGER